MNIRAASIFKNVSGASAAEFALVLPLLILFLFGILDVGRYMWALNRAEKATQMGVRYAVVSDPVAAVVDTDFVDEYGIPGGDPVPTATFGSADCTNTACTVTGAASAENGRNATAFTNIFNWMQNFYPELQEAQVRVRYDNVGLGYSGDPTGPDVSPLTTVSLINLQFRSLVLFGGTVDLPEITASLTMEDGDCSLPEDCTSSN
jgi:Flp pilus assembly protein TadG